MKTCRPSPRPTHPALSSGTEGRDPRLHFHPTPPSAGCPILAAPLSHAARVGDHERQTNRSLSIHHTPSPLNYPLHSETSVIVSEAGRSFPTCAVERSAFENAPPLSTSTPQRCHPERKGGIRGCLFIPCNSHRGRSPVQTRLLRPNENHAATTHAGLRMDRSESPNREQLKERRARRPRALAGARSEATTWRAMRGRATEYSYSFLSRGVVPMVFCLASVINRSQRKSDIA